MNKEMNLADLKKEFPFKWRVQSFSKGKPQAICVPYCDSRMVQDVLDDVCGEGGWQAKYEDVGGVLYCNIGVKVGDEWVWKGDCGSQSNIEKDKGAASDAFKRAGVKWGVGRFLYVMRPYVIKANKKKEDGDKPWHIHCVDKKDKQIPDWAITEYINKERGSSRAVPAANLTVEEKGDAEVKALEAWASKYDDWRIVRAIEWIGVEGFDSKEYKRSGLASIPRIKYALFCNFIKLSGYDVENIEKAMFSFGYKMMESGGIEEMIKGETIEKVIIECEKSKVSN